MPPGLTLATPILDGTDVLSPEALAFVAELSRRFDGRRRGLLDARQARQIAYDAGETPDFLADTSHIRADDWTVAPIPAALQDRRVEITGPVDRKMMINALNSGAKVFMADFEDSLSPTWANLVAGHQNVYDATRGRLTYAHPTKGTYRVEDDPAQMILRPRGWHLDEAHVHVDGHPVSASLFDFGISFFHNAAALHDQGRGPFYYLPKLEHHDEARLWDDVFRHAQDAIGLPPGTIKATVLIETLPAAFQMDEILFALKDHIVGLNAGRWDYIFSCIKTLRRHPDKTLPDRGQVTMGVPHMRAYTQLLIQTCHRRGAFAMGGMSAFIPDRADPVRTENALAQVRADKQREAADGCDGTWVAHPGLVQVAMEIFDAALAGAPNQLHRPPTTIKVTAADLLDFAVPDGRTTHAGVAQNVDVGLRYLVAWLSGDGAAAIHGLMEDAATAEISRSQLWQWTQHKVQLEDGRPVTKALVADLITATAARLSHEAPEAPVETAAQLLADVALGDAFPPFLTIPAYATLQETPA